jgi:hypothetical protein
VTTPTFDDITVIGTPPYYYTVKVKIGTLIGGPSNQATGWANLAPTSASAEISTTWPAASEPIAPSIVDPNVNAGQDDSFVLSIITQPAKGIVTLVNNEFIYTPPADIGFSGDFGFVFSVTDKAGGTVGGDGIIHVLPGCSPPTINAMSVSENLLPFIRPGYTIGYDALACNGEMNAVLRILKDGTEIETKTAMLTEYGNAVSLSALGIGLDSGDYNAELTITSAIDTVTQSLPFQVHSVHLPSLSITPQVADQTESKATISIIPNDAICLVTSDQTIAESDPRKCFVSLAGSIPGLSPGADTTGLPMLTGYPSEAGEFPVTVNTARWVEGIRYDLEPITGNLTVNPIPQPKFALTGDTEIVQGIEKAQLILKQTEGDICHIYADINKAKLGAASGKKTCFATFDSPPEIKALQGIEQIKLEGFLSEKGTRQINYTVSRVYPDGHVSEIPVEGAMALNVIDLPPPILELKGGFPITADKYYVPLGQPVARIKISAGFPTNAKMNITIDDGIQVQERNKVLSDGYYWVNTPALKLMEERTIRIRVSWSDFPSGYTEKIITAIGGTKNNIKLAIDAQRLVTDTEEVVVKVRLGEYTADGLVYDPATMGQWRTQLLMQSNGQTNRAPASEWVDMTNGEAEFRFVLSGYMFMKVTAVAELISNVDGLDVSKKSPTRFVEVLNGSPLIGTISAKLANGPAPKTFALNLDMTPDNRSALKEVSWEESVDDGTIWSVIQKADALRLNLTMHQPGRKKVRAKMVNKNTGVESYSDPVEVWAYSKLEAHVVGPKYTSPGTPATLAAELYKDGVKTDNAVVEWSINVNEETTTQSGPTLTLNQPDETKVYITLKARSADTRPDDINAWSYARHYLLIKTPDKPTITAIGPRDLETGKTYHFKGTAKPSWGYLESVHTLASEWELPDGTLVPGDEMDWTPDEPVLSDPKSLIYRAWVEGFKDTTTREMTLTYQPWAYVWPEFKMVMKQLTVEAPSELIFIVDHDRRDMVRRFEGLTYTWSFPENVNGRQNSAFPNRALATALYQGSYTISVTISDARGHQTVLTQAIAAQEALPYLAPIKVAKSNVYERAPMTVTVRPTITGGHPLDAIKEQIWRVDGNVIADYTNRSFLYTTIPDAGDHVISYTMTSRMGKEAGAESPLSLARNKPPVCQLLQTASSIAVYVDAKCQDADGKVVGYSWEVNGNPITSTSYRIAFTKCAELQTAIVSMTGIDDAGGSSAEAMMTVHY